MQQKIHAIALMVIMTVALSACAAQNLDTPNKRAYAAELAVEGMLDQVELMRDEGRFSDSQWRDIQSRLRELLVAREAMRVALEMGNDPGSHIAKIHVILSILRPYLEARS